MKAYAIALLILAALAAPVALAQEDLWKRATTNGDQARPALLQSLRFVHGWLEHADPATGLVPRNLGRDHYWNARDCAADNYPFMVLTSFYTDRPLFEGRMKDMLATEQRLCNRVDRLPDDYLFSTQAFRHEAINMGAIIFGASEYVKDGLLPTTELLGPSPWADRMLGLLDDIIKNAATETEVGLLPAKDHEVCGELMQSLARMYWMTGREEYRQWTYRIADYFFDHHSPIAVEKLQLDDHGCEVIGGLSEAYYLAAKKDPARRERWRPAMHAILDRILEVGRDENGLLYHTVNPISGKVLNEDRTDNWGYDYNAFLVVAELDNVPRYREAVEFVLQNLMKNKDYPWEGDIADGIADSLEGCLNLMNRVPVPAAAEWADYNARRLLSKQRDTGVVGGWHGDGNFARTALMYALWKSQGAYLEPWRADLRLGAVRAEDGAVLFVVRSKWPWKGAIRFDVPRHAEWLHIPEDYPRLNQFPEWFTVPAEGRYESDSGALTTQQLRAGLPIAVSEKKPVRLRLKRKEGS